MWCQSRFNKLDERCLHTRLATEEELDHTSNPNNPFGVDPIWASGHSVSDMAPSAFWNTTLGSNEVGFAFQWLLAAARSRKKAAPPRGRALFWWHCSDDSSAASSSGKDLPCLPPAPESLYLTFAYRPDVQVFRGKPHAFFPRSMTGYYDGFPVWFTRNLTAHRMHFLFAYLTAGGYLSDTFSRPDELTMTVRYGRDMRVENRVMVAACNVAALTSTALSRLAADCMHQWTRL